MITSMPPQQRTRADYIWRAVESFQTWLADQDHESYDPYDIWGTKYGLISRRIYYKTRLPAAPLVIPVLLMEIFCPQWRSLFVSKQRFATADAHLGLAFLNLYEITGEQAHMEMAEVLGQALLASSAPGYHGHCWGYPFDWRQNTGLWKKNTPFITGTPYCYELFGKLYDLTKEERHLDACRSIAKFVDQDLHDTPTSPTATACSYSPIDHGLVLNTSAYRAMVLFDAANRLDKREYAVTATGNLNFILQNQRADGSWLYSLDEGERFVDHFHTCFVLKNLWKINQRLQSPDVTEAVRKGFAYYERELFTNEGLPKQFAIKLRTGIVRLEMYDVAEAINLGALLKDDVPTAFTIAKRLAQRLCQEWQLPDGHFLTRIYAGGFRHSLGYLRWPQANLFYELTNFLRASSLVR
jgi:hypothetical protein